MSAAQGHNSRVGASVGDRDATMRLASVRELGTGTGRGGLSVPPRQG